MAKPNDNLLSAEQFETVRRHADRLLRDASAHGRFPTPIDDILAAAKLKVVADEALDESALRQFFSKAKARIASGIATLKSALSKVLGLLDVNGRIVVIDKECPLARIPFVKLHEAGHGTIPHQKALYSLIQDCDKTLDPDITELFECEANVFASEALFQGDVFTTQAADFEFSGDAARKLSKQFGASNYSTFRRYVSTSSRSCCLVVLEKPEYLRGEGKRAEVRRVIASQTFNTYFHADGLTQTIVKGNPLSAFVPYGQQRIVKPKSFGLYDRNGDLRECIGESFFTGHHVLVLILDTGKMKSTIILPSATIVA